MIHRLLAILLLLVATGVSAQDPGMIMSKATSMIEKSSSIKASFTITQDSQQTSGDITLKGKKFILEMPGIRCWFDGRTQYTYLKENEEVNISEPDEEELQSINPYQFLSLYKTGHVLKMGKTTSYGGKKVNEVILLAKDKNAVYKQINLTIDTSYNLLRIQALQQKVWTTIKITRMQKDAPIDEKAFTFKKENYPNAEIIDLR